MTDDVIILENVWKIFGERADEALEAIKTRGLGKPEVLEEFACVVGTWRNILRYGFVRIRKIHHGSTSQQID
jgi:ABC-type proline/glycine betaine transport system ATPase subunit